MKEIAANDFYSIKVDKEKNRLYLTVAGFWKEINQVPEYVNDLRKATEYLTNGFTILADLTKMKTPAQDVYDVHIQAQKLLVEKGLLKTAEIHPESMVAKLSVDRFSEESGMKKGMFSSAAGAENWLDT